METIEALLLPPGFTLTIVPPATDPMSEAIAAARGSVVDGAVFLAGRPDHLQMAITLEPEGSAAETLPVALVAMVALGDAVGSLIPPARPVQYRWPGWIDLDGSTIGRLALAIDPDDTDQPTWAAISVDLTVMAPPTDNPGARPAVTSLHEEGGGDIAVPDLLTAFCRQLLRRVNEWQDDGLAPAIDAWNAYAARPQDRVGPTGARVDGTGLSAFLIGQVAP